MNGFTGRRPLLVVGATLLGFLVALSFAVSAQAGTIQVTTTADQGGSRPSKCSLREAVLSANTDVDIGGCNDKLGGDVVRVPRGRYVLNRNGTDEDAAATGDLDVTEALTISGTGPTRTVIRGNDTDANDRVLHVLPLATLRISSVAITDGDAETYTTEGGGGILNEGSLTIERSLLARNQAGSDGSGGAISHRSDGTLLVSRSTMRSNDAESGGALFVRQGDATIRSTTLERNSAFAGGGIEMAVGGALDAARVRLIDNEATGPGGGIRARLGGSVTFVNATIAGNTAQGVGGGLSADDSPGEVVLDRSTVSGNSAGAAGGGVSVGDGQVTLTNVTVSGNQAGGDGGGVIAMSGGEAEILSSTITANTADVSSPDDRFGGGVFRSGAPDALRIGNSIIAANTDSLGGTLRAHDCAGSPVSLDYNLVGTGNNCGWTAAANDALGGDSRLDPLLGPLAANGGPAPTHALLTGSLALETGPAAAGGGGCLPTDERGVPRAQGAACDKGAYERAECLGGVVNRVGTEGPDRLGGTAGSDIFLSLGGRDLVVGRGGADRICGGEGDDTLNGNGGRDRLAGEAGNDDLNGGPGRDECVGGPGQDSVSSC